MVDTFIRFQHCNNFPFKLISMSNKTYLFKSAADTWIVHPTPTISFTYLRVARIALDWLTELKFKIDLLASR